MSNLDEWNTHRASGREQRTGKAKAMLEAGLSPRVIRDVLERDGWSPQVAWRTVRDLTRGRVTLGPRPLPHAWFADSTPDLEVVLSDMARKSSPPTFTVNDLVLDEAWLLDERREYRDRCDAQTTARTVRRLGLAATSSELTAHHRAVSRLSGWA